MFPTSPLHVSILRIQPSLNPPAKGPRSVLRCIAMGAMAVVVISKVVPGQPTVPVACCRPDATCVDTPHDDCVAIGGDPLGPGSDCAALADQCSQLKSIQRPKINLTSPGPERHGGSNESSWHGGLPMMVADWQPADGHKMHFPQLPDEEGWDVNATDPMVLADDWRCSQSGLVKDIHFWGSWRDMNGDGAGDVGTIQHFLISIHEDIPEGQDPNIPWSHPGVTLREWQLQAQVVAVDPPTLEAWFDPWLIGNLPNNHGEYFQYNIVNLDTIVPDPFFQLEGMIYWLTISAVLDDPINYQWGWKSSRDHFQDHAVWSVPGFDWMTMYEPPRFNLFSAMMDPQGQSLIGSGTNYYGEGWYYYPQSEWWNIWFYDNPFTTLDYKWAQMHVLARLADPFQTGFLTLAINWSTPEWSLEGNPPGEPRRPPLPGVDEGRYIGRDIRWQGPVPPAGLDLWDYWELMPYNPEWISIDVMGNNFVLENGEITHECVITPFAMAFVITGGTCSCNADVDGNGILNVADLMRLLSCFGAPPIGMCASSDINCDGTIDLHDFIALHCQWYGNPPQYCCRPTVGACCLPTQECRQLTAADCAVQLGTYHGDGSPCGNAATVAPEACCYPDGTCVLADPMCCQQSGGSPKGAGTNCNTPGICEVLCPVPTDQPWCQSLQARDCNTVMDEDSCLPSVVSFSSPTSMIVEFCDCFVRGQECGPVQLDPTPPMYQVSCPGPCPPGTACWIHLDGAPTGVQSMPSALIPPGAQVTCVCSAIAPEACCMPEGACIELTPSDCQTLGGLDQGAGTQCTQVEACCFADGSCMMVDPLCCDDLGGTPLGAGSHCTALEACCFGPPNPFCIEMDPLCCAAQSGTPGGPGSTCTPQACCMPDDTCAMYADCVCQLLGGTPQGEGTMCTQTSACCLPDGTCRNVDPLCCDDLGGSPSPIGAAACMGDSNGNGTDDACEIAAAACCLTNGTCIESEHGRCVALGGDPQGPNTICDMRICSPIKWAQPPTYGPTGITVRASSTFDTDLDGWQVEAGMAVSWESPGGNPDGFLRTRDVSGVGEGTIRAPVKFLGDWSNLDGRGTVQLDAKFITDPDGHPIGGTPFIRLEGPGGKVIHSFTVLPTTQWQTYSIDVEQSQWTVLEGTWLGTLANVQKMVVNTDYTTGRDENGVDNVYVTGSAPQPSCFWGWDDISMYQMPPIVADDWACSTNQPITDIHWWGSYQNWTTQSPPPPTPDFPLMFQIGIWTDVPAGGVADETCCYCWNPPGVLPPSTCSPIPIDQAQCDQWGGGQYQQCTYYADSRCTGDACVQLAPFSHPGRLIHQWVVPRDGTGERYVGCDQYPGMPADTCFRYDFEIPEAEWFYQGTGTDPTIYWISISAFYLSSPAQYPWGWKTREHFFNDNAVRILAPIMPTVGDQFGAGQPIETLDGESWDMAFVLTTRRTAGIKWEQWPNPTLPGLHAHDGITLADNWECQGGMVTDLHWWGNYELDDEGNEDRGAGINCINVSIHANRPDVPWCVPQDPELWGVCAFFEALNERFTGMYNSEGAKIYQYDFYLQPGFAQTIGEIYWLNLEAFPIDPHQPALWRWQEANRPTSPRLCPAAERTLALPWHTIVWPDDPPQYSDMAFRVTSRPYPPDPDPMGVDKTRFISFIPGNPGAQTALQVTLSSLHHVIPPYSGGQASDFTAWEGQVRWVGPPQQYLESTASGVLFWASKLQCEPYYSNWSTIGLLHVTGAETIPSSQFDVQAVSSVCQGAELGCADISSPLTIRTTRWGDVETPYNPPSATVQPDMGDVSALVNKFRSAPGAPIKARALLFGQVPDMVLDFSFTHISSCVDAFRGMSYPLSGPCACPSAVICDTTACSIASPCPMGQLCVAGFCRDACERCRTAP